MKQPSKIVLITGAASGIGRAIAEDFLRRGHRVIATDRNIENLRPLAQAGCSVEQLDVNDPLHIKQVFDRVKQGFGYLDILVNNAGYGEMGPIIEIPHARLVQQFNVNVFAPLMIAQAAVELMIPRESGLIINVGSVSGILTTPFAGAYCASKSALHAISEALSLELAPFSIRTLCFQPGGIASNFGASSSLSLNSGIKPNSRYLALVDRIYARAQASQKGGSSATDCARYLVDEALRVEPKTVLRFGRHSRLMPLLKNFFPRTLRNTLLLKKFGLNSSLRSS